MDNPPILLYERLPAVCLPYDSQAPAVAAHLIARILPTLPPGSTVEHVGSTSVPGCAGKGVIDLLLIYPPGGLAAAKDALAALGFGPQPGPDPWPEERPMRVGSIEYGGPRYRLHMHVLAADNTDIALFRRFREALRADPALVAGYVAAKQAVLAAGVQDSGHYAQRKSGFIETALDIPLTDGQAGAKAEPR